MRSMPPGRSTSRHCSRIVRCSAHGIQCRTERLITTSNGGRLAGHAVASPAPGPAPARTSGSAAPGYGPRPAVRAAARARPRDPSGTERGDLGGEVARRRSRRRAPDRPAGAAAWPGIRRRSGGGARCWPRTARRPTERLRACPNNGTDVLTYGHSSSDILIARSSAANKRSASSVPMKKLLGSLGIVAVLGAGAFAISTVLPAGAQSTPPSNSSSSSGRLRRRTARRAGAPRRRSTRSTASSQNGTINQDQENAVIQALKGAVTSVATDGSPSPRPCSRPGC